MRSENSYIYQVSIVTKCNRQGKRHTTTVLADSVRHVYERGGTGENCVDNPFGNLSDFPSLMAMITGNTATNQRQITVQLPWHSFFRCQGTSVQLLAG